MMVEGPHIFIGLRSNIAPIFLYEILKGQVKNLETAFRSRCNTLVYLQNNLSDKRSIIINKRNDCSLFSFPLRERERLRAPARIK
jgi:hypothetical protein